MSMHYLSGLVNVLVVLVLLFLGFGPRRIAAAFHLARAKLAPAGDRARALAKQVVILSLGSWR